MIVINSTDQTTSANAQEITKSKDKLIFNYIFAVCLIINMVSEVVILIDAFVSPYIELAPIDNIMTIGMCIMLGLTSILLFKRKRSGYVLSFVVNTIYIVAAILDIVCQFILKIDDWSGMGALLAFAIIFCIATIVFRTYAIIYYKKHKNSFIN